MASYAPRGAGEFIVSASDDCTAILWERQDGATWNKAKQLGSPLEERGTMDTEATLRRPRDSHTGKVTSASFAQDCTSKCLRIATSSEDGTAIVWRLTLDAASGGAHHQWDIDTVAELRPANKVGGPKLRCVAWSPCSVYLLTTSWDMGFGTHADGVNCVQVWRLDTEAEGQGASPKLAADGAKKTGAASKVTAAAAADEAGCWRDREGVCCRVRKLAALQHTGWVWSAEFAPDDAATIVSASSDKRAIVWRSCGVAHDVYDGKQRRWLYKDNVALWEDKEALNTRRGHRVPEQVIYNGSTARWEKQSCEVSFYFKNVPLHFVRESCSQLNCSHP